MKNRLAFLVGRGGELASTSSLDDARSAIEEFRRVGIDMVAISGGDGTAHRTIEVLIDVYAGAELPPVLLLPTGTQNMVPGSFGIRNSGVTTLLLAMARYRHNIPLRCIRRNVLKVNEHFGLMFGLGLTTRALQDYYRLEDTTPAGAAKLLGRYVVAAIRGTETAKWLTGPIPMEIRFDEGRPLRVLPHSVFCSFIEEIPLRFKLFPRAGWDEGVFEVMQVKDSLILVSKALPSLWWGSTRPLDGFDRAMARRLELVLDKAEPYALDGDIYEPTDRFLVEAGPEIRFVVPGLKLLPGDGRVRSDKIGPWDMQFIV